jgi:hypothetical protein
MVSMGNMNFTQKGEYNASSSYNNMDSLDSTQMKKSVFQKDQSYGQFSTEDKDYKTKRLKQYVTKKLCFE